MVKPHIALVKALSLKHFPTSEGACHGITMRWLEACLLQQEDLFQSRIEKVLTLDERFFEQFEKAQEKIKRREELTEDELALYDMHAFLDSVALYHRPFNYRKLFNAALNQPDIQAIAQLAGSDAIQAQGGLASMHMHPQICTKQEIEIFLKKIAAFVDASATKDEASPVITFLLSGTNHAIGLTYQIKQHLWSVMDINQWPPVKTKEIQSASQTVYLGLLDACSDDTPYVAFNIALITNTIKQLPDFSLNLKTIRPEINSEFIRQRTLKGTFAYVAAQYGDPDLIAALAGAGANLDTAINNGSTPAFIAAQHGYVDVIALLAKAGANLDTAKNNGATPAFIAAQRGHAKVIAVLSNAGANLDATDNNGATPAFIAAQERHADVIALLAKAGANLDAAANNGATPACVAAYKGHADVIAVLAEAGINLDTANNGITPAFIAAQEGHTDVIKLLPFNNSPYNATAESLRHFAKDHTPAVQQRMEDLIADSEESIISVYPEQIAYVMGHDEIVLLLKEKKQSVGMDVSAISKTGIFSNKRSHPMDEATPTLAKTKYKVCKLDSI